MTLEEQNEYYYKKHYNRERPKRVPKHQQSSWEDWEHKDFFETMTFLNIKYHSSKWKWLENKPLQVIEETEQALEVQAIDKKTLRQWIPKFLLINTQGGK